jgi:hypothetical protein
MWGLLAVVAALGIACAAVLRLVPGSGAASRAEREQREGPASLGIWFGRVILGGAGLLLALALVWYPLRAELACRRGDRLLPTDVPAALQACEEATAFMPGEAFYFAKLGAAARQGVGQVPERTRRRPLAECGRAAYARAAELVPANASYHLGLGRMNMELARLGLATPKQALDEYNVALTLDANNPLYYADAANAALVMEQLPAAHTYTRAGLDRCDTLGQLWAQYGYIAMLERHPEEAVQRLLRAMEGDWFGDVPAYTFAQSMLAKARQQAGQ